MRLIAPAAFGERPRAVLIDLDDTLYGYEGPHRAAMAAVREKARVSLNVRPDAFEDAFRSARDAVKRRLGRTASSHSRLLYFQGTLEALGLNSQVAIALDLEQTYWRTLLARARLLPGAEETLIELRAAGLPLACVTDLTAQIQFRKLVYFEIDRYFDVVVTSEEAGVDKAGGVPFSLAMSKLGLDPRERVWCIGDAECDVEASKEVLNVATLQRLTEDGPCTPHAGADAVFRKFSALRVWLRGALAA
ncbi:HAD hydrolase-like protein [Belnapia sp. T18]|uniref:HAD hydrolase-like protein n=1 Tax=Belnapia arida TaxID=2804533 RepID=A0ABS1U8W3_9PROT|nr:HAD family hydrolase [Belnapia arida]MBL6081089.1 HAD hydrolase-like protein [Belnapia arida]